MTPDQKQRTLQMLRRFEQADPMTRQADNAAVDMAALLRELIDAPEQATNDVLKDAQISSHSEQEAGVPDGWKLVPVEPTNGMRDAGPRAAWRSIPSLFDEYDAANVYRAMLAAAPEAPAVQETWSAEQCAQVLRALRYIQGIAERGEGRPMRDNESLEKFLLGYVQRLERKAPAVQADLVKDAERYRWLRTYNTAKHPAVTEAFFLGDENLDAEIDAAIAVEKGGA